MKTILASDEVLQKLLDKRSEIITQIHENVVDRKKSELSESDKKKAQNTYEQDAFFLEPTKVVRTSRATKKSYQT